MVYILLNGVYYNEVGEYFRKRRLREWKKYIRNV